MSEQEILQKAIDKATAGGFIRFDYERPELEYYSEDEKSFALTWHDPLEHDDLKQSYHSLFDQHFAKALWGETTTYMPYDGEHGDITKDTMALDGWKYYLQQMVVADDPIRYLEVHS